MFFSLVNKIPFIECDTSKRKLLKIFIIGAVMYVILHYYMITKQNVMTNKIMKYLYYVVLIDLGIAYFLSKKNTAKNNTQQQNQYSPEQLKAIQMQRMLQLQQMQLQQAQQQLLQQEQPPQEEKSEHKGLFKKKEEKKEEEEEEQKEQAKETKKKVVEKSDTETCLPIYMGKNKSE